MAVIHDEQEFKDTMPELWGGIQFSADSAHFSISGKRGLKPVVIIDGKQYPCADMAGVTGAKVIFSPNSERWAYLAVHGRRIYWVVSGVEYGPYGAAPLADPKFGEERMNDNEVGLYFSPDGRHFVFRAMRDGRHLLVVDGLEREFQEEWFPHSSIIFDSARTFHFIVRNSREINFVEENIEQK
jgi:hypothetical protein